MQLNHPAWKIGLGTLAAASFVGGAWLIIGYLASIPPDPDEAEPRQVVDYFFSDHFERLPDAQQKRYVRQMVERYGEMDDAQRDEVEAAVAARREQDSESMRDRMIQMWKDYVVTEAERYVQVPMGEREVWLEQRVAGWRQMFGGPPDRDRRGDRDRNRMLTPERQRRAIEFMREEVMPRSTARERALVSLLARDIMRQR